MPELPDLEVIRRYLASRLTDVVIADAEVRRPLIVRNLLGGEAAERLVGRRFLAAARRGKFLLLPLDQAVTLAINPMLAGRIRYGEPLPRDRVRDALVLRLADGRELRYHDPADMGKVYLTADLAHIPTFSEQGPEANDPDLSLEAFRERLRRYPGEIKGILTNQSVVAGIGNAYADEILWRGRIYPFRKRSSLSHDEIGQVHRAMRETLAEAIAILEERMGDAIDVEIRDFLAVHGKPGQPCPRCGSAISEVTRERRSTHFCRTCQPWLMIAR